MDIPSALAILGLAALLHASFQLSVSVLTLLNGHAIGAAKSQAKILRLSAGFIAGAGVMTLLLLATLALFIQNIVTHDTVTVAWALACGLLFGVGLAVWVFYYRREKGTRLWVPQSVADHLTERTKATKRSAEAFGLGLTSVIGEIMFIIAPLFVSALVLVNLPVIWQLLGVLIYAVISILPLLVVAALVGSGHKLSRIQRWREENKGFLQFAAGSGMIILAAFIFAFEIMGYAESTVL